VTPERYKQVRDLADAALDRTGAERALFLETACGADEALRAEAASLLAAYDEVQDQAFLNGPPMAMGTTGTGPPEGEDADDTLPAGRRLGPYELVDVLGRGGMGVVYRAVRADDEYRHVVAVKVVRRGMATALGQRRFREERQILAGLEHPGIARLLDGGTTDEGLPYLVMEYVQGQDIDTYCDQRKLGVPERLRLFLGVCAAVHHAHRSLVVHRDIKPGNVLVTADGSPKLLDFGIARLLRTASEGPADPTVTVARVLTPDYASPEQVRGQPVTTATDVYSLGVLLYELLSGHRPYRAGLMHEVLAAICEEDPERPSSSVARTQKRTTGGTTVEQTPEVVSGARGTTPAALRKTLSGDLDTIVLKALRKAPEERYASAEAFAEDVRRHLEGRPVQARPQTLSYRAGRFVARNRAAVGAAALVVVALLGGLFAATRQARIAERERALAQKRLHDVRRLSNSLIFEMHDGIAKLAGATEVRRLLVQRATEYLDLLAAEAPANPEVARDLAEAHERLADVLGGSGAANLGDPGTALSHYRRALALRERLAAERPDDLERQRALAASLRKSARAESGAAAVGLARRAVEVTTRLAAADPGRAEIQSELAAAHYAAGLAHMKLGEWPAALNSYRSASEGYQRLRDRAPGDQDTLRSWALCEKRMGAIMTLRGQWKEGAEHYRRALAADESRAALAPENATARRDVSVTCVDLSVILPTLGDPAAATALLRRALAIREELARADPSNALAQMDLISVRWRLADLRLREGDWRVALRELAPAVAAAEKLSGRDQQHLMNVLAVRATAYERAGNTQAMLADRRRAFAIGRSLVRQEPSTLLELDFLELALALGDGLGAAARRAGPAEAAGLWREARDAYAEGLERALSLEARKLLAGDGAERGARLRAGVGRCEQALRAGGRS
jgi:serine/threonine protein kinase